jgi:hypothetical protein
MMDLAPFVIDGAERQLMAIQTQQLMLLTRLLLDSPLSDCKV